MGPKRVILISPCTLSPCWFPATHHFFWWPLHNLEIPWQYVVGGVGARSSAVRCLWNSTVCSSNARLDLRLGWGAEEPRGVMACVQNHGSRPANAVWSRSAFRGLRLTEVRHFVRCWFSKPSSLCQISRSARIYLSPSPSNLVSQFKWLTNAF